MLSNPPPICPRYRCRRFVLGCFFLLALFAGGYIDSLSNADELSENSPIYGKLAKPMNAVFDGKAFRSAITGIADQVGLNVWIDRQVDPTTPVKIESSGSTVYGAIQSIAASRNCVLMPVGNVLLIGHRDRVAKLTAVMLKTSTSSQASASLIDVTWDDLTTPSEALKRVLGSEAPAMPHLPHDLWPKTTWKQVKRSVAIDLILAQFDLQYDKSKFPPRLTTRELEKDSSYIRRYSSTLARIVRPKISSADPNSRVRLSGKWLQSDAKFNAHLQATNAVFSALKPKLPDPDKDTFTLKEMRTTAANALQQLCSVAGRRCEIADNAIDSCEKVVTVQGTNATLRDLIELVASQAGVKATWQADVILISR